RSPWDWRTPRGSAPGLPRRPATAWALPPGEGRPGSRSRDRRRLSRRSVLFQRRECLCGVLVVRIGGERRLVFRPGLVTAAVLLVDHPEVVVRNRNAHAFGLRLQRALVHGGRVRPPLLP